VRQSRRPNKRTFWGQFSFGVSVVWLKIKKKMQTKYGELTRMWDSCGKAFNAIVKVEDAFGCLLSVKGRFLSIIRR